MEDMRAFFDEMVALSKKTGSMTDKTAAVRAFIECSGDDSLPALPSRHVVGHTQRASGGQLVASRADTRGMPYLAAHGAPTWPAAGTTRSAAGSNIFADVAYHVDAAATLAGHAARQSGFGTSMAVDDSAESTSLFKAYLEQFAGAPHWLYKSGSSTKVDHSTTNHAQFTRDLAAVITAQMNSIDAGQDAIDAAVASVNTLASLLTSSTQSGSITNTLYTTIGISREPANEGPLYYGIFYMTLHMDHQANGRKSQVLSTQADTYALLYQLDSPVLVQNADLYARLTRTEVEDWFANLEIY